MVTKKQAVAKKRGKVKVGKLNLKKETVKDLTGDQQRRVKGAYGQELKGAVSLRACDSYTCL